ncbi:hypothetical protein MKX01_001568 [Papaver californicum]|nr:hypothetical protein MKX01_001568 [Papaver californicum]
MRNYLIHKKLWHCVIEEDPTNSILDDDEALSILQYSITSELLPHIMYAQNAHQAWVWLEEAAAASAQVKEKYDETRLLAEKAYANANSKRVRRTDKVLTQRNYKGWSVYMKNVLTSEYLWGIVDGSETSGGRGYRLKSECAYSIIKASCSPEMRSYISLESDGKTAWDKLAAVVVAAEKLAAEKKLAVEEKLAADAAAAEKLAAEEKLAVEEKLASDAAAAEKLAAEEKLAVEEKLAADAAATEKLAAEEKLAVEEKLAADAAAAEKLAIEEKLAADAAAAAEKEQYDQMALLLEQKHDEMVAAEAEAKEKLVAEMFAAGEKLLEEKLAADEKLEAAEKLAADAAAAEKLAADIAAAEKLAADAAAAEKAKYDEMVAAEEAAAAEAVAKQAAETAAKVTKLSKVVEADKVFKRGNYQKWSAYMKILLEVNTSGMLWMEAMTLALILWDKLAAIHKDEYIKYSLLLHAIQKEGFLEWSFGRNGNFWENTVVYLEKNPEAATAYITEDGSPALHVAVGLGRVNFVKDLLSKMIPEELEMKTRQVKSCYRCCTLNTAISIAAEGNNMEIVEMMVKLNPGLLLIENEHGHIPLISTLLSAVNANEEMIRCIYKMTSVEIFCEMSDKCIATFLTAAARLEAYDIVLDLLQRRPEYGITQDDCGVTLLSVMAEKPSAFPSGNRGSLQNFIRQSAGIVYGGPRTQQLGPVWSAIKRIVPGDKQQIDNTMKQSHALIIVKEICNLLLNLDPIQLTKVGAYSAIHLATIHGIVEVFDNLLDSNPNLVRFKDDY